MTFAPRTWVVGETVTAALMNQEIRDQLNSMFAAWTSYTPTWSAATTNPVVGNGTLVGLYMKVGRTCTFHINLLAGSTTTYGSGQYTFDLPAASANRGATYVGNAHLLQGTTRYAGQVVISPGVTSSGLSFPTSNTVSTHSLWLQGTPVTLANGAQIRVTCTYETAT
ncbi:hypothetical protein ABZ312_11355 [Streptomyces sp. NPDC006207]